MRRFILFCMLLVAAADVRSQDTDSTLLLADAYFEARQWDKVVESYTAANDVAALSLARFHRLAIAYIKLEKYTDAERLLEKLTTIKGLQHIAWFNLGEVQYNTGRYQSAMSSYQRAAEIKPQWAWAWMMLGYAALNAGCLDEAWEAFHFLSALDDELAMELLEDINTEMALRRDPAEED
jgi:tetratricopeptide (TPR) repeat protein